eukprot:2128899-Amphidinium_carterae.1
MAWSQVARRVARRASVLKRLRKRTIVFASASGKAQSPSLRAYMLIRLYAQTDHVNDGIQSTYCLAGVPRRLEPRALEPTPTQKKELGMGLFLKHAGFSKRQQ